MQFKFCHLGLQVANLEKSIAFYKEAAQLEESFRKKVNNLTFVYLTDKNSAFELELKFDSENPVACPLGENPPHLALRVDDFDAALEKHTKMSCVKMVKKAIGIYFIEDPDGYALEIMASHVK